MLASPGDYLFRARTHFLKGPVSTQPPPLPAGAKPLPLCCTFLPLPLMLVSLPSKMGDFSGSADQRPQSQYYECVSNKPWQQVGDVKTYGLGPCVPALIAKGLFHSPGIIAMPREEASLYIWSTAVACAMGSVGNQQCRGCSLSG